jgi:hypothetical protein
VKKSPALLLIAPKNAVYLNLNLKSLGHIALANRNAQSIPQSHGVPIRTKYGTLPEVLVTTGVKKIL